MEVNRQTKSELTRHVNAPARTRADSFVQGVVGVANINDRERIVFSISFRFDYSSSVDTQADVVTCVHTGIE